MGSLTARFCNVDFFFFTTLHPHVNQPSGTRLNRTPDLTNFLAAKVEVPESVFAVYSNTMPFFWDGSDRRQHSYQIIP